MGTATGYPQRVPKPKYTPSPEAAADVQKVVEMYKRWREMEAECKQALAGVVERHDDLTVAYLAEQLGVERKTVYRHLGKKMT